MSLTDREADLAPSDPSEPSADHGPRAAGAAGRRPEPRAAGRPAGPGGPGGSSRSSRRRRQSQTVLPPVAPPLPVGRPALRPAHPAGVIRQVRDGAHLTLFIQLRTSSQLLSKSVFSLFHLILYLYLSFSLFLLLSLSALNVYWMLSSLPIYFFPVIYLYTVQGFITHLCMMTMNNFSLSQSFSISLYLYLYLCFLCLSTHLYVHFLSPLQHMFSGQTCISQSFLCNPLFLSPVIDQ